MPATHITRVVGEKKRKDSHNPHPMQYYEVSDDVLREAANKLNAAHLIVVPKNLNGMDKIVVNGRVLHVYTQLWT